MDKLSKDKLDGILLKSSADLDAEEIGFLRARKSYLSEEEVKKYASVLNVDETPSTEELEVPEEVEKQKPVKKESKPKKKTKKQKPVKKESKPKKKTKKK